MALGKNFHFWTTFLVATEAALCVTLGEIGTQKCLALCVTVATIQFDSVCTIGRQFKGNLADNTIDPATLYLAFIDDIEYCGRDALMR